MAPTANPTQWGVDMRVRDRWVSGVAGATIAALVLAACASSSSGSRATLYESIDQLAADSSAIVVGTVHGQRTEGDVTISSVEVTHSSFNPQLGANLTDESAVAAGDVVEVRQDVASSHTGGDHAPLLSDGDQYMLFLTPTMLEGDAAAQYFITGAVAGLYVRDGADFRRVVTDSGDALPERIATSGSEGG